MMRMKIVVVLVVFALFTLSLSFAAEPEKIEKVVATGIGINLDKAKQNAMRNAVEQVIGTYVSSDTLVKNNQVIKDQILSYSGGYLKDMKVLSEEKTDDGLFSTKIEALVISTKLKRKIESLNIAVKKVESESLFGEAFSKVENQKSAQQMIDSTLAKFPKAAYIFEIGKPSILGTTPTGNANVSIPIVLKWDESFLNELKSTLSQVGALELPSAEIESFDRGENRNLTFGNKVICLSREARVKDGYADVCYIIGNLGQSGPSTKAPAKKKQLKGAYLAKNASDQKEITTRLDFSSESLLNLRYYDQSKVPLTISFKDKNGDIRKTATYNFWSDYSKNVFALLQDVHRNKYLHRDLRGNTSYGSPNGPPNVLWRNPSGGHLLILTDGAFAINPEISIEINILKTIDKIEVSF